MAQLIDLRNQRENKGYSIRELSKISGVSTATISRIECGLVDPKISIVQKLAGSLEISLDELVLEDVEED